MPASNPIKESPAGTHLRTMSKERDPPGAFFCLGTGPASGRRYGPPIKLRTRSAPSKDSLFHLDSLVDEV